MDGVVTVKLTFDAGVFVVLVVDDATVETLAETAAEVPEVTDTSLDVVALSSSSSVTGNGSSTITPVSVETGSDVEVLETLLTDDEAEREVVGAVVTTIFSASWGMKLE